MYEAAGLSGCRDEVIPAACREMAIPPRAGDVGRDRITAVEIVEQPAVEAVGLQRRLNGGDVDSCRRLQHGLSIAWGTKA